MSEHFLESDVAILKEKLRLSQEIVGNLSDQLDRAQEVILASLPALRLAYRYPYDGLKQEGVDSRFLFNNEPTINHYTVYSEAKEILGLE